MGVLKVKTGGAYVDISTLIGDHNYLNSLQGGSASEYYHLSLSLYNDLQSTGGPTFSHLHLGSSGITMNDGTGDCYFNIGASAMALKCYSGRNDIFNNTASSNGDYQIRNKNSGSLEYPFSIMGLSNNVKLSGTALRGTTEGTNHLDIFNGTAPVGTLTNGCSIYSSSGELYTMDAAGNATLQTPHDDENKWIFYSKDTVTGKVLKIDMERFVRAVNEKLGMDFVHDYVEEIK
jgi:hypothetical protein